MKTSSLIRLCLSFVAGAMLSTSAHASDDSIFISNLYMGGDDDYWSVASSDDRQLLFNSLSRDLGIAISHRNLAPGETLGFNGFELGLDTTVATVSSGALCDIDSAEVACQHQNDQQDAWRVMDADHRLTFGNALVIPTLRVRKGLPLSTEVGADLSYLTFSHQTALSLYGRVAFHEGMWDKTWRVIPDVALTVAGTRYLGNEELSLSVAEWNATFGWTFPVGGIRDSYVGTFSPFFGAGKLYITSLPQDPLPNKLEGLNGVTGSNSRVADATADSREVEADSLLHPWKLNVGMRVASGIFRLVASLEVVPRDGRLERPGITVGAGFLY